MYITVLTRTRKEGGGEAFLPSGRAIWVLETPIPALEKKEGGSFFASREGNMNSGKSSMETDPSSLWT